MDESFVALHLIMREWIYDSISGVVYNTTSFQCYKQPWRYPLQFFIFNKLYSMNFTVLHSQHNGPQFLILIYISLYAILWTMNVQSQTQNFLSRIHKYEDAR